MSDAFCGSRRGEDARGRVWGRGKEGQRRLFNLALQKYHLRREVPEGRGKNVVLGLHFEFQGHVDLQGCWLEAVTFAPPRDTP